MEKYKKYKEQKGAISIFTVLSMIFFLTFVLGAFMFASRRSQTQLQTISELKKVYKQDANAIYDELAGDIETNLVPIYSEKDFEQIKTGIIRTINGKNYLFSESASYVLKNDIKIPIKDNVTSNYQPKDYTLYDGKKSSTGALSVNENGYEVNYMYDLDKDGEDEKYKLIAYSKEGSGIPANTIRNENNFNIIGTGDKVGDLETINLSAYKYSEKYHFLLIKCERSGSTIRTKDPVSFVVEGKELSTLQEIIEAYISDEKNNDSNFNSTAKQYYLFVRNQDDAVKVYIDGSTELEMNSHDDKKQIKVVVVNNTKKTIEVTIDSDTQEFVVENTIKDKKKVNAKTTESYDLTIKPKDKYYYTNIEKDGKLAYTVNINVDIERQYIGGKSIDKETLPVGINTFMTYKFRDVILAKNSVVKNEPNFKENVITKESSGLFKTIDETGDTYYFRGVVENNYVSFANETWRIIRINGDGSYRIILNSTAGKSAYAATADAGTVNTGYMYSEYNVLDELFFENSDPNKKDSKVKEFLDNWYDNKLTKFDNYIDKNAIFWNDREISNLDMVNGNILYKAWDRIINNTPTLKATETKDMFSHTTAKKGNKKLSKPIGLITADEVVYAGGTIIGAGYKNEGQIQENTVNYLNLAETKPYGIWTMTPRNYHYDDPRYSLVILSKPQAGIYWDQAYNETTTRFVKPVINLKSTVKVSGDGTKDNPYIVKSEK